MPIVEKVISGGQTGVDRAALDAALALGVPVGGFCPKGRRAEDGPIAARYPLQETRSPDYADRTRRNVSEGDATLILSQREPTGGTALTVRAAREGGKPCRRIQLPATAAVAAEARRWLADEGVAVLNVAGPRASEEEGIYEAARAFVEQLLAA